MNKKINYRGFASLIFFLSESMFIGAGLNQILNTSKNTSILSCIFGIMIGLIIFYLYYKLSDYERDLDLTRKIEKLYGKKLGNIINILIIISVGLFFTYTLWNTEVYIQNKYLDNTPSFVIILLFLIPIIYSLNKDFKVISKLSILIFIICLIEIILTIFGLISYLKIDNFKPFFLTDLKSTFKGTFYFISLFFTPIFLLLIVPKNSIDNPKKATNNIIKFILFSGLNILVMLIFIIGIFGIDFASTLNYPEFVLIKKINYFNFIEHIENILSTQWLFSLYVTACVCILFIKKYLENKNINTKFLYIFIIVTTFLSLNMFKNSTSGYNAIKKYYHLFITIPYFILLILSNILIKIKRNN